MIETLEAADPERKCFRQIGGVLCERTVKEVLPQLVENKDFIAKTIQMVTNDLSKKGSELNKFKEEHNIKIRGEHLVAEGAKGDDAEDKAENRNVLVFNWERLITSPHRIYCVYVERELCQDLRAIIRVYWTLLMLYVLLAVRRSSRNASNRTFTPTLSINSPHLNLTHSGHELKRS